MFNLFYCRVIPALLLIISFLTLANAQELPVAVSKRSSKQFFYSSKKGKAAPVSGVLQNTICNPLNLNYRFCLDEPSRREAADPTIITFKDEYYLFASKSGGYWHSVDLIQWDFITSADLPFENYAPTAVVIKGTIYFMASGGAGQNKIYKTDKPKEGKWEVANAAFPLSTTDPDLFLDDDGKLYLFYGCSDKDPIYGVELDLNTLMPKEKPTACFNSKRDDYGWERNGDYNESSGNPWIEGAWMTKYKGKYYLQYSAPGTQYKSYADGLYTADQPLGPFKLALNNPCSYKPEGFIAGAGHSSTFKDKYGNYWHVSTMTISVKHMFERRLGLFPMFFDQSGELYTYTGFGDFPFIIPQRKISGPADLSPGWMLLSYHKPVEVSSALKDYPKENAANEDIRTYWSAKTGKINEWISIDLQKECTVNAIQLNFADHDTQLKGRSANDYYQYQLQYSNDGKSWKILIDKSLNTEDGPHDYIQLAAAIKARYLRIMNYHVPDGTFAISGFRVFGNGNGKLPKETVKFVANRNLKDKCEVKLSWNKIKDAVGYNVRYGTQPDKLYQNYEVLDKDSVSIRSLNKSLKYYFTIDSFNENGIKKSNKILSAE